MAALAFPTLSRIAPSRLDWGLLSNTQVSVSPGNGSIQTLELPGARWRATLFYDNLFGTDLALMQSFLTQLRGQANRILLPYFPRPTSRGAGGGTPVVNGSGQTGTILSVAGATPSVTGWLLAGDCISFGTIPELHMVKADANSNGAGVVSLSLEPPIRTPPAGSAAVTIVRPIAHMMLTESDIGWTAIPGGGEPISDVIISCVEAFA